MRNLTDLLALTTKQETGNADFRGNSVVGKGIIYSDIHLVVVFIGVGISAARLRRMRRLRLDITRSRFFDLASCLT